MPAAAEGQDSEPLCVYFYHKLLISSFRLSFIYSQSSYCPAFEEIILYQGILKQRFKNTNKIGANVCSPILHERNANNFADKVLKLNLLKLSLEDKMSRMFPLFVQKVAKPLFVPTKNEIVETLSFILGLHRHVPL